MTRKKKITLRIIIAGVLTLAIALFIYNYDFFKAYYKNARYNHFNYGDKVYVGDKARNVMLFRLGRSNKTSHYELVPSHMRISGDSLRKYKSTYIGDYMGHAYLSVKLKQKKFVINPYIIKPNKKVIDYEGIGKLFSGYSYVDNNF